MRELSLYTGSGGGLLGTHLLGWQTVCAVEIEEYARDVLLKRQKDGLLPKFPIWDNAKTFNGEEWRGRVDVVTAGFPCQPFSVAGKRKGELDERNMWPDTYRIIREVQPKFLLLENVPGLLAKRTETLYRTSLPIENEQVYCFEEGEEKDLLRIQFSASEIVLPSYFGRVLGDLAESGYDCRWKVLSAAEVGGSHKRDRVWIAAYSTSK